MQDVVERSASSGITGRAACGCRWRGRRNNPSGVALTVPRYGSLILASIPLNKKCSFSTYEGVSEPISMAKVVKYNKNNSRRLQEGEMISLPP